MPEIRINEGDEVYEAGYEVSNSCTWDLYAVILFSIITLIVVFLFEGDITVKLMGIPLILFFLGYSIFSYISIGREVSGIDKICYSVLLSILITLLIFAGMTANRLSCEKIMKPALTGLVMLTVTLSVLTIFKRFRSEGLFIPKFGSSAPEEQAKAYRVFTGALAILLVASYLALIPLVLVPKFGLELIGLEASMVSSQNSSAQNVSGAGLWSQYRSGTSAMETVAPDVNGVESGVFLQLTADRTQIRVGEEVNFTLMVLGTSRALPVEIRVNSSTVRILSVSNATEFNLTFSEAGVYNVSAYFPGYLSLRPAESNTEVIEVLEEHSSSSPLDPVFMKLGVAEIARTSFCYSVLFIQVSVVAILAVFRCFLKSLKPKRSVKESPINCRVKRAKKMSAGGMKSIRAAYRNLFNLLIKTYGLRKSLTPRELLVALKKEPFYRELEEITLLHEKAVYCRAGLSEKERRRYFLLIRDLVESIQSETGGERYYAHAGAGIPGKAQKAV